MQTLLTFQAFLAEKYAPKTAKMYWGDVRELSIYLKNKKVKEISSHDLQQWIGSLVSPAGKGLERKTVNRKVSAITTYFLWLQGLGAISDDPTMVLNNTRIQSPLPDYLYETEIKTLSAEASNPTTSLDRNEAENAATWPIFALTIVQIRGGFSRAPPGWRRWSVAMLAVPPQEPSQRPSILGGFR